MAKKNFSAASVGIDGLSQLQRQLKQLSPATKRAFGVELKRIVDFVAEDVRSQMPEKSGKAKRSVRVIFSGGYLAIKAGGPNAPYYPWLDFGGKLHTTGAKTIVVGPKKGQQGPSRLVHSAGRKLGSERPFIKEGRWIYPTIARQRPAIYAAARAAVDKAKRAAGL